MCLPALMTHCPSASSHVAVELPEGFSDRAAKDLQCYEPATTLRRLDYVRQLGDRVPELFQIVILVLIEVISLPGVPDLAATARSHKGPCFLP
jgi:hypothetical protein